MIVYIFCLLARGLSFYLYICNRYEFHCTAAGKYISRKGHNPKAHFRFLKEEEAAAADLNIIN